MEVGELHDKVVYELNKPFVRIKGFGQDSKEKGYEYKSSKSDRKRFKKEVANECAIIKHIARRFDIDNELLRYITPKVDDLGLNPTKICNQIENIKLPFPVMWIEFKAKFNGVPQVCAVLVTEKHTEFGTRFFNFYSEAGYFPVGYKIYTDAIDKVRREKTPIETARESTKYSLEEKEDFYEWHRRSVSNEVYGLPHPSYVNDFENIANCDESLWESFAHEKFRYEKLVDLSSIASMDHYTGTVNSVTEEIMGKGFLTAMMRIALVAIETLNYPWVQTEKKMRVVGKKSKTPRIVPHDHYYKAKILLPKEEVVEIERNQPRKEHYGMRQHQVRGHWRVLKNEFGEVRKRIWIDSFVRGNPKLGIVYKDYVLEGDKQKIKEEQKV